MATSLLEHYDYGISGSCEHDVIDLLALSVVRTFLKYMSLFGLFLLLLTQPDSRHICPGGRHDVTPPLCSTVSL